MDEEKPSRAEKSTPDSASRIAAWMIVMLWVLLLGGATLLAQGWLERRQALPEARWTSNAQGTDALTLKADRYGQYLLMGSANNQEILFLLDTGASGISIPGGVATRLGLVRGQAFDVNTANGITEVYATELKSLAIGPFRRERVQANINPSMEGDIALLGMSFLRHFELLQRSEELTISQP